MPSDAQGLLEEQLTAITENSGGALTIGLIVSILAALWSASGGIGNLVTAINLAYDEVETRNPVKLKLLSLGLTFGSIVFVLIAFGLVAVVPAVLEALPLGVVGTILAQVLRWGAAPRRLRRARWPCSTAWHPTGTRRSSAGSASGRSIVTVVWVVVSLAFSLYVDNFGSYDKTYGAIAGVIVLMLWLYLTCYLVLLGAEINSEAEHQTAHDTTDGEPRPMGGRDAVDRRHAARAPRTDEGGRATRPVGDDLRLSAHVRGHERRPDDAHRLGAPADVDGDLGAVVEAGRRVQQRQADADPERRREGAAGDRADRRPTGDRAPSCPGRGICRPGARSPHRRRAGPASFSASSASRPQNSGFLQPTAQPLRA